MVYDIKQTHTHTLYLWYHAHNGIWFLTLSTSLENHVCGLL